MIRYIKIALIASVSVFCLAYAMQNVVNLEAAHWFVSYTTGMEGHEKYPSHFGPAVTSPAIHWVILWIIAQCRYSYNLPFRGFCRIVIL